MGRTAITPSVVRPSMILASSPTARTLRFVAGVHHHDGGFVDDDAFMTDVDQRIAGTQINAQIVRYKAHGITSNLLSV